MKYTEDNNLISDAQYGGRKKRMAQSVVLNRLCYYNISHQTLQKCAFMDDDARACYDRIVTSLNSLECQKWGLSKNITDFTNKFNESQNYHVRSAYGISKDSYSFEQESPTQGSGQGVSWAGSRWTNTCTTICNVMERENTGMRFVDPTGDIVVTKTIDLFVDDTATGVTENNIALGESTLEHLEKDEQKHALLLYASGHLLALYKRIFYFSKYKLKGTKFVHTSIEESPGELHLKPKFDGYTESIRRLEPDDAHETLGIFVTITNNQSKQLSVLKDIVKEWTRKIQSSPLSNEDKLVAYTDYLEAKLLYVLPLCSLTYVQCQELDKLLSSTLFNIHGFQKNTNRNVLYMSEELGGLSIYSVYHLQGVSKLQFFLKHYREEDTTGQLLETRYTQLEAGVSTSFFQKKIIKHFISQPPRG